MSPALPPAPGFVEMQWWCACGRSGFYHGFYQHCRGFACPERASALRGRGPTSVGFGGAGLAKAVLDSPRTGAAFRPRAVHTSRSERVAAQPVAPRTHTAKVPFVDLQQQCLNPGGKKRFFVFLSTFPPLALFLPLLLFRLASSSITFLKHVDLSELIAVILRSTKFEERKRKKAGAAAARHHGPRALGVVPERVRLPTRFDVPLRVRGDRVPGRATGVA